jgi:octaprenyl-diphosphate synthase
MRKRTCQAAGPAGTGAASLRPVNDRGEAESAAATPAPIISSFLPRTPSVPFAYPVTSAPAESAQSLLAPIAADMCAVDSVIRARLESDVALIRTIADYIIGAGGKRLRPAVLLLVARALGYSGSGHHLLAAVIEFIHTATLLHDDVVDESDLRRGRRTANATFGNAASVLVGDFLYSRAFQMMVEAGHLRILRILADATNRIAEGEVMQLLNVHDASVDEQRYLMVVERKTATLFEAAARIGAVLSGAAEAVERACGDYGAALGAAFQIVDDVLDYSGNVEEIGKRVGDDLREGKVTLPLIHALSSSTGSQREVLQGAIEGGGGDFVQIAQIVRSNGSLDYARGCAALQSQRAEQAALQLPPSPYRTCLLDLNAFALGRDR